MPHLSAAATSAADSWAIWWTACGPYTTLTNLFTGGYGNFVIKWDPIRGLGPVSTKTGCFTCHGAGVNVLTGTAGDTSTVDRYSLR